jgi:hypothetical protein
MTDTKPELELCPHCGHQARRIPSVGRGFKVGCGYCSAQTDFYHSEEAATDAWNRRAPSPVEVGSLAQAAEYLRLTTVSLAGITPDIIQRVQEYFATRLQQMADKSLRLAARPDAPSPGQDRPADAWLIVRSDGSKDVVLSPLTDDTYMDEGDEAWPLYLASRPQTEKEGT